MILRTQRFPFEGLLSYRPLGQREWVQGMTIDISLTGVLFRTPHAVEVDKIIQMIYVLPIQIPGRDGDVVLCEGRVVRSEKPSAIDRQTHVGAKILDYTPGLATRVANTAEV